MPRLAVLGHPVGHSRSPAMHSAALAELGLGGGVELRGDRRGPRRLRGTGAGAAGRGLRRRQRHRPAQGRRPRARRRALGDRARDRRRQHARLRGRRDPRREHRRRGPAAGAARLTGGQAGAGAGCRRRGARRRLGVWSARAPRSRSGTAPSCARSTSAKSLGGEPVADPEQSRLRADRQLDRGRPGRRGPLRRAAARPAGFAPEQTVVDMVYGGEHDRAAARG